MVNKIIKKMKNQNPTCIKFPGFIQCSVPGHPTEDEHVSSYGNPRMTRSGGGVDLLSLHV